MSRLLAVVGLLLGSVLLSGTAAAAAAPAPACASAAEGARLRQGMVPSTVEHIVGLKGKRRPVVAGVPKWDIPATVTIEYRVCTGAHPLIVTFEERDGWWRLKMKVSPWHGPAFGV